MLSSIATPRLFEPQQAALIGRRGMTVDPERAAGLRVERHHVVRPLRDVHDAVDHQRRRLPCADDVALEHPFLLQVRDVRRRDLIEQGVALARVPAVVSEPVVRLAQRPSGCGRT